MHAHLVSPLVARLLSGVALAFTFALAHADYVWIEGAEDGAVIRSGALDGERKPAGELDSVELRPIGDAKPEAKVDGEVMRVTGVPEGRDVRARAYEVLAEDELMYYQARWGRNETKADLDFELVPTEAGGNTFQLMWMGSPVKASYVRVSTSAGWSKTLDPNEDGSVTLDTPFPGLYVLQLTARASGWAEIDGKRYTDVRHTATLSFTVEP
ncbi:hypothetical protein [Pseudazoarcus pumilus]|uniref:DUF4198 domain-containing protein n=1 Tax=Pseudazoarcus pumilus TaxID=2067960 RepID=A0A2I6S7Q3_9RHOO|nr:hypothetical protein [Pseudazoarcus pumilus]AUN95293.1 hypothetical protein C0099_10340 [Pseudazoarcus pumilus]